MGMVDQNDIRRLNDENGISIEEWMHRWGSRPEEIPALALDADQIRASFLRDKRRIITAAVTLRH